MLNKLPEHIIADIIICYLTPKQLCRLSCVNKSLYMISLSVASENCWKLMCIQRWKDKAGMSKEPYTELFPWAIYFNESITRFSIKELRMLLLRRGVDTSKLLERQEYVNEVIKSNPVQIQGWAMNHVSKWKTSLIYSIFDSTRTRITRRELTRSEWEINFKQNHFTAECKFNADGTFWSTIRSTGAEGLTWYMDEDHEYIYIGPYPQHRIGRDPKTWAFYMENNYVVIKQKI